MVSLDIDENKGWFRQNQNQVCVLICGQQYKIGNWFGFGLVVGHHGTKCGATPNSYYYYGRALYHWIGDWGHAG